MADSYGAKLTKEEFIGKIGWEGGIISALEYGLKASDLDWEKSPELAHAWSELEMDWNRLQPKIKQVEDLIPDEDW